MKFLKLTNFKCKMPVGVGGLLLLLLFISVTLTRCSKDTLEDAGPKILSSASTDYQHRLANIRENFYSLKLDINLKAKTVRGVSWTPDWKGPRLQIINDSVSYVFYKLIGEIDKDGEKKSVKEANGATYLMVKNEKEFYYASYYVPQTPGNKADSAIYSKELKMDNFTGKLLLTNLQNKENFLIDYASGHLSDSYRKMGLKIPKKVRSGNNTILSWEQVCHTELKHCRYITYNPSYCGGEYWVVLSDNCYWPTPICGAEFYLVDSSEETVCEDIYFPDPPQPADPGNGGSGGGESAVPLIEIDRSALTAKFPCATKLVVNELEKNSFYNDMVKPFMQTGMKPTLTWDAADLPWGADDGVYIGASTLASNTGRGASSTITLNSGMINSASKLLVSAVAIHETYHAYINYMFAFGVSPSLYNKSRPTYMAGLYQYILYNQSGAGNYNDHYNILTSQFDNFTKVLYDVGKGSYSMDDCRMALLFGMNNPGPDPDPGQAEFINQAYNDLLSKYGYAPATIASFNSDQVNFVAESKQLPNSGCQ